MTLFFLALGGGIGAGLRWLAAARVPNRPNGFPLAITGVNVVGSFVLGLVVGWGVDSVGIFDIDVATVGVLGGFTTYSTWMVDVDRASSRTKSFAILGIPLALGIAAAAGGVAIGVALAN